MPHALHPHTPEDDLHSNGARAAEAGARNLLTPDISSFCQSGVSVIVALGGKDVAPIAGPGCGCRILEDGSMRVVLLAAPNTTLIDAARRGAPIAVTFSQPFTHRSIQVKGGGTHVAEPDDDDREAAFRQMAGLCDELREIEYSSRFSEAFCFVEETDIAVISFTPEAAFVQTPGPGAGAELKP